MKLINDFLSKLEEKDIHYVHWKSNTNIDQALDGIDDLDILVSPFNKDLLESTFKEFDIIKIDSEKDTWQEGIINYAGLDIDRQELVHVHLHYKLTLGYDFDKCFDLPLVNTYLSDRSKYKTVYLPKVEYEYIILVIRLILKNSLTPFMLLLPNAQFQVLRNYKKKGIVTGGGLKEFLDLKSRVDKGILNDLLSSETMLFNKVLFNECEAVITKNDSLYSYFKIGIKVKRYFKEYSTHNGFNSFIKALNRLLKQRITKLFNKFKLINYNHGKIPGNGGRIIAFVGGDGAGKSTTIKTLKKTLSKQLKVKTIHIGRPKRSLKGIFFGGLSKLLKVFRLNNLSKAFHFIGLAYNRQHAFNKAKILRDKGVIVLLDRIPLEGIKSMDCPRVHMVNDGKFNKLIQLEEKIYKRIKEVDLLFVLKLNPTIALERRPEDDPDELMIRSGEIWNDKWNAPNAIQVNTGENGPENVQKIVLSHVWKSLNMKYIRTEIVGLNGTGKSSLLYKIEEKFPNCIREIPYKKYPLILLGVITLNCFMFFYVLIKTKKLHLAKEYLQLKMSLLLMKKWAKNNSFPTSHMILDQGPIFKLALLIKEDIYSNNEGESYKTLYKKFYNSVYHLECEYSILRERVLKRAEVEGVWVRSVEMNDEEFVNFCDDYEKIMKQIEDKILSPHIINCSYLTQEEVFSQFKLSIK